jgi:N utilization substance protein A
MAPQATTPLENVPGLGEGVLEKLTAAGVTTVEALADMTPEQLEAIEGIGPKTVEKISLAVNNYFASLEAGAEGAVEAEAAEGEAAPEEASAEAAVDAGEAAPAEPTGETESVSNEAEPVPDEGTAQKTTE